MGSASIRTIERHVLPLSGGVDLLHPERVVLDFMKSRSVDIGGLCYLARCTSSNQRKHHTFEPDSLSANRVGHVRRLIYIFSNWTRSGGMRQATLFAKCRNFVKMANWCDANARHGFLDSLEVGREALQAFSEYLRERIRRDEINQNQAAGIQSSCIGVLNEFFDSDRVSEDVRILKARRVFTNNTRVPSEDAQSKLLTWCQSLFSGLTTLVLNNERYPFLLGVPAYLEWPSDSLWVFPLDRLGEPPTASIDFSTTYWDYSNGRVRRPRELLANKVAAGEDRKYLRQDCWTQCTRAQERVDAANSDRRASIRLEHAGLAAQAFFIMFMAETGMNLTQLIDLEWNEEGKQSARRPEADRQGFRAVKYRAGGKTVFFEIGASFMPMFRRYLDLRAYILDGMQFPYLLVNVGPIGTLQQFNMNSSALLQGRLRRFDPHLPRLCPRQWRSAKQDWAISNHDPVTAAEIMQHTLDTTLKMYSNGTESVHQREFTDFLTRVDTVVMEDGEVFDDARVSSLGMCTRADLPKSISADPPIEPNCGTSEGCLFCDKYRVHADETDTRKLLSCRLCVRKTATLATSHEQFERMFGRVLQRIDFVLEQIRQREPALVARVENEVDSEGELDAYWSIKLERLMELGIA